LNDYTEVFDNQFVSFLKQCQNNSIIDKKVKFDGIDGRSRESLATAEKRCHTVETGAPGMDSILTFYSQKYR
jgi:hypothetical protein